MSWCADLPADLSCSDTGAKCTQMTALQPRSRCCAGQKDAYNRQSIFLGHKGTNTIQFCSSSEFTSIIDGSVKTVSGCSAHTSSLNPGKKDPAKQRFRHRSLSFSPAPLFVSVPITVPTAHAGRSEQTGPRPPQLALT